MKKLIGIGMVLLLILGMAFASGYNSETGKYTVNLNRGWNLVPNILEFNNDSEAIAFYGDTNYVDTCPAYSRLATYVYSPIQKSYLGILNNNGSATLLPKNYDELVTNERNNGFYHAQPLLHSKFVYSDVSCYYEGNLNQISGFNKTTVINGSGYTVAAGWNLITFAPWMIGKEIPSIFENCDLVAANSWSSTSQNWSAPSSSQYASLLSGPIEELRNVDGIDVVNEQMVGQTLAIKVASDCKLSDMSSSSGPPILPN